MQKFHKKQPARDDRRSVERRTQHPAPGKVTRTSKLPAAQRPAVQSQTRAGSSAEAVSDVASLWDHTMDPWMDAALRGTPPPAPQGVSPESAGKVQYKPAEAETPDAEAREPAPAMPGPGYAIGEVVAAMADTRGAIETIGQSLLPAYGRAVDALDAPAALQLATAAVDGLRLARASHAQAEASLCEADPYAQLVSRPGEAPVASVGDMPPEVVAEYEATRAELAEETQRLRTFERKLLIEIGPQVFRGQAVLGSPVEPPHEDAVACAIREASAAVEILVAFAEIRALLGELPGNAPAEARRQAASKIEAWRARPVDFRFFQRILVEEGYWPALAETQGTSGRTLGTTAAEVVEQSQATGDFADVGAWHAGEAAALLDRGLTDWAVTDEDAEKVFEMIRSAAPAARAGILRQLDGMGKLDLLCENLPWRWVQALHDGVDDPAVKARLRPHFIGKGDGKSLSREYEENVMENLAEGNYVRGYLWTFLQTAHNGLTFGFLDAHDSAYDASEAGWISSDAYLSATGKALGRSAAIAAATIATGGAAGAWGEGVALGLNAGRTTAQVIGGGIGGMASGVSGQLTADLYDQALLGKEGFSDVETYLAAAGIGAATGAGMAALPMAPKALPQRLGARAQKYLEPSMRTMSEVYAARYPGLDNLLTRLRNSGARTGMRIQVTSQELVTLARAGLVDQAQLAASLERIGAVYRNHRIDTSQPLTKVHPQSEIERFYGSVDSSTGKVHVQNPEPSSAGYAGVTDQIPPGARSSDKGIRDTLGIDGPNPDPVHEQAYRDWGAYYDKYKNPNDPLFEVVFRTKTELDVPLHQDNSTGYSKLGAVDPVSHHVAGAGRTKGGVQEGILPPGAPIEILDIRPVGAPRASYPATGQKYGPFPSAPGRVRSLQAPLSGALSGSESGARADESE